jgi:hypothetical protein
MADIQYQRLTSDRLSQKFTVAATTRTSLWLGEDHLLLVCTSGFTETYKRFYFRDIQAITVAGTSRYRILNAALGALSAICLAGVIACSVTKPNIPGLITWAIFAVVFLVPLLLNIILGPTCTCQIRTAVQTEDLPSLSRLRKTRKVLDRIRPLVEAVQGRMAAEEVSARMHAAASGAVAEAAPAAPEPAPAQPEPPPAAPPIVA